MIHTKLWSVRGKVWKKDGGNEWVRFDMRNVVIAVGTFKAAYELAEEALLHNWSPHAHEAQVVSIQPFVANGDQVVIVYPENE